MRWASVQRCKEVSERGLRVTQIVVAHASEQKFFPVCPDAMLSSERVFLKSAMSFPREGLLLRYNRAKFLNTLFCRILAYLVDANGKNFVGLVGGHKIDVVVVRYVRIRSDSECATTLQTLPSVASGNNGTVLPRIVLDHVPDALNS